MILRVLALLAILGSVLAAQQVSREASILEFPQLPGDVAQDLNTRGCTVPQPLASRRLTNVIQGHFRDSRQMDWAVLCDSRTKGTSMLLVYWSGNPSQPVVVSKSKLQHNSCWTEIAPVGKAFIMEHYQAYGGPKPPPVDHQGINVGICDKASTVSYFYRKQWLTLTGSD
jgi:hypothetical protein